MVDAVSMATQLANWEVYSAETRVQTQLQTLSAKRSALSSINSQLSSFNTLLDDLTGYNKSVVKNSADSSDEELLTAQADAGAQSANYQIFVEQLAQRHQLSTQLPAGDNAGLLCAGLRCDLLAAWRGSRPCRFCL